LVDVPLQSAWIDGQGLVVAVADHLAVTDVLRPGAAGEGALLRPAKGSFSVAARGVQLPVRLVSETATAARAWLQSLPFSLCIAIPKWAMPSAFTGDSLRPCIGPERYARQYPARGLARAGPPPAAARTRALRAGCTTAAREPFGRADGPI
jgi:hypothetical protein